MSEEKLKNESDRWFKQAEADQRAARDSLASAHFEWACFQAQQCGEKSLKALWYYCSQEPWGHSLVKLIKDFPVASIHKKLAPLLPAAQTLDKVYIPSRYPNGLPDSFPSEIYTKSEAQVSIKLAASILSRVRELQQKK